MQDIGSERSKSQRIYFEVHHVNEDEMKDPVQTTVGMLPEEDSPCMVNLVTLATVILLSRVWLPSKNTIVVLEVKYSSASCTYSESVVQLADL